MKQVLRLRGVDGEFWRMVAFAEDFARRCGLPDCERSRVMIILEELFTNAVRHGFRDRDAGGSIEIALAAAPGRIEIGFCDNGAAFDPLSHKLPETHGRPSEAEPGGQGLRLVRGLAHEAGYRREGGCNRLRLVRNFVPAGRR
jgi:serine/threonine-protein kinase RsbW